jgi:RNA polymerase sigma factor (TIGR02999 family)
VPESGRALFAFCDLTFEAHKNYSRLEAKGKPSYVRPFPDALSMTPQKPEVTQLLKESARGDRAALDQLLPLVYGELRLIADRYLRRERADHTLQATALVHEAYLRLVDQRDVEWQNRAHFFGVAAQMMRRILVDHARAHQTAKRGSGGIKVSLDDVLEISDEQMGGMLELDEALTALERLDPQKSRIVELRFFGGLSIEETAEALGVGTATVIRQWRLAKAWLYQAVTGGQ